MKFKCYHLCGGVNVFDIVGVEMSVSEFVLHSL